VALNTPLKYHFKDKHLWFDVIMLAALFVVATYIPLLKIVPLVACLELFSFFSYHLLAKRSRFQLQGFLGGFISSTAVFLQILNDNKYLLTNQRDLLNTLFFALCAMLLECLFIIFFLSDELPVVYYLPFITQFIVFFTAIIHVTMVSNLRFENSHAASSAIDIELLNDHPIIWKNVAKLSVLIFLIISVMNFIGSELAVSRSIATLLVSLFEAHAILASVMMEWPLQSSNIDLIKLFFIILLGNTLSKSYLAIRGKNLTHKGYFVAVMLLSFLASIGVTYIWFRAIQ